MRGLAAALNIAKPAITRALHRLEEFQLVRRKIDPKDRRSGLVQRTERGAALLREVSTTMTDAAGSQGRTGTSTGSQLVRKP